MKNIRILSENFQFLVVKFSIYLNSRVFVMSCVAFICHYLFGISSSFGPSDDYSTWLWHFLGIVTYIFTTANVKCHVAAVKRLPVLHDSVDILSRLLGRLRSLQFYGKRSSAKIDAKRRVQRRITQIRYTNTLIKSEFAVSISSACSLFLLDPIITVYWTWFVLM